MTIRGDWDPLRREARTALAGLDKKVNVDVDMDRAGITRVRTQLGSLDRQVGKTNRNFQFLRNTLRVLAFPAVVTGLGAATQAVSALSAGVVGLTGALAPLTGALVAYPTLLGTLGQAAGVTALAGIKDLTDALGGNEEAFKRLTPEGRKFYDTLKQLEPQFRSLQDAAQRPLFGGLRRGIEQATNNLPALRRVIGSTAAAMGQLAERAGRLAGSRGFGRDFRRIGLTNVQVLRQMGDAGLNLGRALTDVLVVARPLIRFMARSVNQLTEWIRAQAQAGRESGRMARFFEQTRQTMQRVFSIAGRLAGAFYEIGKAAAPLGRQILAALDRSAGRFEQWTKSMEGRNALREYFQRARPAIFESGRLVAEIAKSFVRLGAQPGVAKMLRQLRTELLPVLEQMFGTLTRNLGPAFVSLFTELGKLLNNISGASGPLSIVLKGLTNFLKLVNAVPGAKSLLSSMVTFALAIKAIKFASAITGLSTIVGQFGRVGPAATAATGGIGRFRGALGTLSRGAPIVGGVLLGLEAIKRGFGDTGGWTDFMFRRMTETQQRYMVRFRDMTDEQRALFRQRMVNLRAEGGEAGRWAQSLIVAMNRVESQGVRAVNRAIRGLSQNIYGSLRDVRRAVEVNMDLITRKMGTSSSRAKKALSDNFDAAVRSIRQAMAAGVISTSEGTAEIDRIMQKQLRLYGLTRKDILQIVPKTAQDLPTLQPFQNRQTGGMVVPGSGSGDKVPLTAMVEPGERVFVLNRNASAQLEQLHALNSAVPRFQKGGAFPRFTSDHMLGRTVATGLNQVSTAAEELAQAARRIKGGAGRYRGSGKVWALVNDAIALAQKFGLSVTSLRRPWDTDSYHSGLGGRQAVDLAGGDMAAFFRAAIRRYGKRIIEMFYDPLGSYERGGRGAAIGGHSDHVHIAFQRGGLLQRLQRGGGINVSAYNRVFRNPNQTLPFEVVAAIAESAGLPGVTFAQLAKGESTLRPGVTSPDGGYGLWQITPRVHDARHQALWKRIGSFFNPVANARMAKVLYGESGLSPWFGDQYVTGSNLHYKGKITRGAAGAADPTKQKKKPPTKAAIRKSKLRKRMASIEKALGKAGELGLGPAQGRVDRLRNSASLFGEYAEAAASIGTDDTLGVFQGQNEAQWLQQQLDKLFALRNMLAAAYQVKAALQRRLSNQLERMRERLRDLTAVPAKKRSGAQKRAINNLRLKIPTTARYLEGISSQIGVDSQDSGGLLGSLASLQGTGLPKKPMAQLGFGQLGGEILQVQLALREAGERGTSTDNTAELLDLTRQQLRTALLEKEVLRRQYPVFQSLRDLPQFGGSFADGGVVPGPKGAPRTIIAHGGEFVDPSGQGRMRVVIEDHRVRVFEDDVERAVETVNRRTTRGVGRTPGVFR